MNNNVPTEEAVRSSITASSTSAATVDTLLDDARKLIGESPQNSPEAASAFPELVSEDMIPNSSLDEMSAQVKALTEEVKLLREQMNNETKTSASEDEAVSVQTEKKEASKSSKVMSVIGSILFYAALICFVIGVFLIKSSSGSRPTMVAGYSAFTVLSSSMEDVYPKGSLIVTKSVDASELAVGDDITFMVSETTSITHRIIGITEEYLSTGQRAFETKGTMNEKPDKEPVAAANVVGKVIFCSKTLGNAATIARNNWPLLVFGVAVIAALIAFLKWNAQRPDDTTYQSQDSDKKAKRTHKH